MRYFFLSLLLTSLFAIDVHAQMQPRFWESLSGQRDTAIQRVAKLENPKIHHDSLRVGDSVHINTYYSYDTTFYTDTVGTRTALSQLAIYDIAILPSGVIVMASDQGILRSSDDGKSWRFGVGFGSSNYSSSVCVGPAGVLYAGAARGFYRSDDQGLSWTALPHTAITGGVRFVRYSSRRQIYVIDEGGNMWSTSDEGKKWNIVRGGGDLNGISEFAITPYGTLLAIDASGLVKSDDDATTWSPAYNSNGPCTVAVGASGAIIFANSVNGSYAFHRSNDEGRHWSDIPAWSFVHDGFVTVGVSPTGTAIIADGDYVNGIDTAFCLFGANTASPLRNISRGELSIFRTFAFDSIGRAYGGTKDGGAFRSKARVADVPKIAASYRRLTASPNPCVNVLNIGVPLNISPNAWIEVWNYCGVQVLRRCLEANARDLVSIDVRSLPDGIYSVVLRDDHSAQRVRFVVLH